MGTPQLWVYHLLLDWGFEEWSDTFHLLGRTRPCGGKPFAWRTPADPPQAAECLGARIGTLRPPEGRCSSPARLEGRWEFQGAEATEEAVSRATSENPVCASSTWVGRLHCNPRN